MNYDLTIKDFLEIIQKALDGLKGKNVQKDGGISKSVESALNNMEIDLFNYNVEVEGCRLKMFCSGTGSDITFADIITTYRPDKRKWNGVGDYLETVSVKLTKDIPMELEVINASQWLDYNNAKENFDRLEREQREMLEEYKKNLEAMKSLQDVMKCQAYDEETRKKSKEAEVTLESLYL